MKSRHRIIVPFLLIAIALFSLFCLFKRSKAAAIPSGDPATVSAQPLDTTIVNIQSTARMLELGEHFSTTAEIASGQSFGLDHISLTGTGDVYCVTPGGGSYPGCAQVFTNVQTAVDAATGGETIKIATGNYTDMHSQQIPPGYPDPPASGVITQVVYISKTLTIQGGYTTADWTTPNPETNPTTLDAQGQGRVLYITGAINPILDGLRIIGGNAGGLGGSQWGDAGGGIYVITATATISGCQVFDNTARDGGGLYLNQSDSTIRDSAVTSNTILGYGGGLYLHESPAILRNNIISHNTAANRGGGLSLNQSNATLIGNIVADNTVAQYYGGGLFLYYSDAALNNNTIISNTANSSGGGLHLWSSSAILSNNAIKSNSSGYVGGGLRLWYSDATLSGNTIISNTADHGGGLALSYSNATLINNIVADNRANINASGLSVWASSPDLLHTTIARNTGGDGSGIHVTGDGLLYSTIALTNTILVSQTVGITVTADATGTNSAILNGVLWFSNGADTGGPGLISVENTYTGDPMFDNDGYHLTDNSAAIDRGIDAGVTVDIDGESRPADAGYDLGADESPPSTPSLMKWLFLIYLNGDNDLADAIYPTIADLTTTSASTANVTSLVLWDGEGINDSALYEIANGIATPVTAPWLGVEADMGNSQTLVDFVTCARDNYPTDYTFLSILDHGGGWSPEIQVEESDASVLAPTAPLTVTFPSQAHYRSKGGTGMAWDYHTAHGDYSFLSTSELHDALDTITSGGTAPIDVLFYDACFMGMLEEAHALAPDADYFIASENQAWASQAYGQYLSTIESNTTPEELATAIVGSYEASLQDAGSELHPYTLAALDLSQIGAVNTAFANLSQALYDSTNDAATREQIHAAYLSAQKFDSDADGAIEASRESYVDLYHFAENLTTMVADAQIVTRAQALLTAWDAGLVVAEVHGSGTAWMGDSYWNLENAHGLSVYLPFGEELVMVIDQPGGGTLEVPIRSLYGVKETPHARWRDFINDFVTRGWGGAQALSLQALPDRPEAYIDGPREGLLPVQWVILLPLVMR